MRRVLDSNGVQASAAVGLVLAVLHTGGGLPWPIWAVWAVTTVAAVVTAARTPRAH
jgi:hypothetical protein